MYFVKIVAVITMVLLLPLIASADTDSIAFYPAVNYGAGNYPISIVAADLNGDGLADLATANYLDDSASVMLNSGTGTFPVFTQYAAGGRPRWITAARFNNDASFDLAVCDESPAQLNVLMNNGNGTFPAPVAYTVTGISTIAVYAADVNGDAKTDLITTSNLSNLVVVYINNGSGGFAAGVGYATASAPFGVYLGKFDNDNDLDIATANLNADNMSILMNNGDGTLPPRPIIRSVMAPGQLPAATSILMVMKTSRWRVPISIN